MASGSCCRQVCAASTYFLALSGLNSLCWFCTLDCITSCDCHSTTTNSGDMLLLVATRPSWVHNQSTNKPDACVAGGGQIIKQLLYQQLIDSCL